MNFRTTYILFGLLIAALGVFLVFQLTGKKKGDLAANVFPSFHSKINTVKTKDIASVEIQRNRPTKEKLVFEKTDKGWRLTDPNTRADSRSVDQLITQVLNAKRDEKAELSNDFKQFGLDSPTAVVTLATKEGDKKWTLDVGDVSTGGVDAMAYVRSSDRPKEVLAVRRTDLGSLFRSGEEKGAVALKDRNDYRSKDLLASHSFDIQQFSLQDGKHGPLVLKRTSPAGNNWIFEKPPLGEADYSGELVGGPDAATKGGVLGLITKLAELKVETAKDFVADNVTDLAKYGLDAANPERLRIEVTTQNTMQGDDDEQKGSSTSVLLIGKKIEEKPDEKKPEEKKPEEKKPGDKKPEVKEKIEKYYAALDEGDKQPKTVVKVSGKLVDEIRTILRNPNSLRTRDLVNLSQDKLDKIDWITVENGKETFQLRRAAADWDLLDASGKARKADPTVVDRLLELVKEKRQVKDYPEPNRTDADLGLDKPSAAVAFYVEGVKPVEKKEPEKDEKKEPKKKDEAKKDEAKKDDPKKDEKKEPALPDKPTGSPAVTLKFGKRDKDLVYVLRELGEDRVRAAVSDALLTKAQQEKIAYLDRKLPDFPRDDVTKVVLVRDGQTYEIAKEEKDGKTLAWKFTLPETLKGRTAETPKVVRILDELAQLYADKLVGETANDSELERYGLKTPATRVTLTVKKDDKKTEERVYLFGKEADDKSGRVHARMSEREWVFLVRPDVLAPLKEELADTTVFNFDPAKVKALKLTGWQAITGTPWRFDLERKAGGGWSVKAPPDFKLDDSKTEALMLTLSRLKAMKFVVLKGGAKPDHKLKVADGALEIEMTIDGEKEPYSLTVGALSSADKGYFATSNKLPGDVFLLPEGMFAEILKRPAYFAAATPSK